MRRIAIAATLIFASTVDAQTLYKCVSRSGTSYQQTPCPSSARLVSSLVTTPEPAPTVEQLAEQARKAERDRAESAFLSHMAGSDQAGPSYGRSGSRSHGYRLSARSSRGLDGPRDACKAAKVARERAIEAIGLNRTVEILRRLDDGVAQACKEG